MRVFITKYALTKGVEVAEADAAGGDLRGVLARGRMWKGLLYFWGDEWHVSAEAALAKAEDMRKRKIASLKKALSRLEDMKFTVPSP